MALAIKACRRTPAPQPSKATLKKPSNSPASSRGRAAAILYCSTGPIQLAPIRASAPLTRSLLEGSTSTLLLVSSIVSTPKYLKSSDTGVLWCRLMHRRSVINVLESGILSTNGVAMLTTESEVDSNKNASPNDVGVNFMENVRPNDASDVISTGEVESGFFQTLELL
ncbi:hypothetical protein Nepgr_013686 [Nepenthes gracilis]|uniref:Uncharacterized protein n=1 Tax=Nepenthes gracilis TaxID=150966 RepID=A0AAD3SJ94_NEPGR|nr:hypothetical protein Nepgr_013686 [Nepenthes gracilis]